MKSMFVTFLLAVSCDAAVGLMREYIFSAFQLNWDKAQSYCRENYRDLATVSSSVENQRLLMSGSNSYGSWTGLRRRSNVWTWSDGEPISFPNWFGDWRFISPFTYDCAVTAANGGFLPDYICRYKRYFYCYRFLILVNEKKTWDEAQEFCRTNYTGLASVTSESSLNQLKLEMVQTETERVWTGLRFMNGQWFWVNGDQLENLVSLPSCPAQSYRCGALNIITNTMNNYNCNEKLNFVCYWK